MTLWYCKNCGELSLRLICEHCGKPRDTRLRIALLSMIGLTGIPICAFFILYVGNVYAAEVLIGYNSNIVSMFPIVSFILVLPTGYAWLFLLAAWIDQDSVLKEYWMKNPNIKKQKGEIMSMFRWVWNVLMEMKANYKEREEIIEEVYHKFHENEHLKVRGQRE